MKPLGVIVKQGNRDRKWKQENQWTGICINPGKIWRYFNHNVIDKSILKISKYLLSDPSMQSIQILTLVILSYGFCMHGCMHSFSKTLPPSFFVLLLLHRLQHRDTFLQWSFSDPEIKCRCPIAPYIPFIKEPILSLFAPLSLFPTRL